MLDAEQVRRRHESTPLTKQAQEDVDLLRRGFQQVAVAIVHLVPDSRERSLALTQLEQAHMWANAGIARNQPDEPTPSD